MDRWKYVTENGRKESGFENLKTRFQDCNLSRKQESKPDGMIEKKQSAKKIIRLCGKNENKKARKKATCLSIRKANGLRRKPSVNLYGWNEIKMYHNKPVLQ